MLLFRNNEIEFLSHISSLKLDNVLGISSMAHAPWDTLGPSLTIVPVKGTIIKVLISKTVNTKSSSFSLLWKLLAKKSHQHTPTLDMCLLRVISNTILQHPLNIELFKGIYNFCWALAKWAWAIGLQTIGSF